MRASQPHPATDALVAYVYDTVQRLHDSRFNDKDVRDIRQYLKLGPLGQAFKATERKVGFQVKAQWYKRTYVESGAGAIWAMEV